MPRLALYFLLILLTICTGCSRADSKKTQDIAPAKKSALSRITDPVSETTKTLSFIDPSVFLPKDIPPPPQIVPVKQVPWAPDREWEDEIIYVAIISKFHNGDPSNDIMLRKYGQDRAKYEGGYWGGDLAGVIQKIDYLADLGITTLFLYPVMQNDDFSIGKYLAGGYRPTDYYKVDENLGDMATLQELVRKAHERGMRVILDMPLLFPGFAHPLNTSENYANGFLGKQSIYGVRQWNAEHPQMADYLIRISKFWRDQTGCDGFRLDTASSHSHAFWKRYAEEIRKDAPAKNFFLMAELAIHPSKIGEFIRETGFDSAYDFSSLVAQDVFGQGKHVGLLSFVQMEAKKFYPDPIRMCGEIDNYDMVEFLNTCLEPKEDRMRLALTYLLTNNRIPLLYLGDEASMTFDDTGALFDPKNRNERIFNDTKRLIALRKTHPALRRGDLIEVHVQDPAYAFVRKLPQERILVAINRSSTQTVSLSFPIEEKPWKDLSLKDLLHNRSTKQPGSADSLILPPVGAAVMKIE